EALGVLVSPNATLEEMFLLRRIADRLGSRNIDHRLRRRGFRDQGADPVFPWLGCAIEGLERRDAVLVVGSKPRLEAPRIGDRLRRRDFRDQDAEPVFPWLGCSSEGLERRDAILVVGSNLRMEAPLIAHRVRNAALDGAAVTFVNPAAYTYYFEHEYVDAPIE